MNYCKLKKKKKKNQSLYFVFVLRCFKRAILSVESLLKAVNHLPTKRHLKWNKVFKSGPSIFFKGFLPQN